MRLDWRGSTVWGAVARATAAAIDETTEEAAQAAQGSHSWGSRTGNLEAQIVNEPAQRRGRKIVGRFGSTKTRGFYGLFLERRTPFLRPAADRAFPALARRIRRRL